jgi:hypothetical protein
VRQIRKSGWIPISISSRTECCVGFVFTSPAAAMYGTSVRWMKIAFCATDFVAELTDCFEERQRLDVADRAADLHDHHVAAGATRFMCALISSVTCGMTCTVLPRYSPRRSLWMTFW